MKLYYSKGACSLVPRIIINELGLNCEFEAVDLASKKTASGENFTMINPKGAVPVLITPDNRTLTENAVILQYLADTNKAENLLPPVGNFKRYRVLEWLNYVATELHKSFGPLFNKNLPQEFKDKFYIPMLKNKLAFVNTHLEENVYLTGDTLTLPDAYLFVMLIWAHHFKIDLNEWPGLLRYFKDLQARKSIQKSLEEEGLQKERLSS
jgi:glutathione S-transferase